VPDDHRTQITQLATAELDRYASQLARCLKALDTRAPIRADVQHELAVVHAEQDIRASAARPGNRLRPYDVAGLADADLERTRRELAASLALSRPGSPARIPIQAQIDAIDAEVAPPGHSATRRRAGEPGRLTPANQNSHVTPSALAPGVTHS
jgi:hypothetical protein